jgi:RNA polymerase sigma factor (sigma-70 family)
MHVQIATLTAQKLVFPPERRFNGAMEMQSAIKNKDGSHAVTEPRPPSYYNALLVSVGKDRDKEAFAELFEYFAPRVKSFLIKGGAKPDAADELAQETMITLWQKAASYDPAKANASTWLFTIARNKRVDTLRKKIRPETEDSEAEFIVDEAPLASEALSHQEEAHVMENAIGTLPQEQADLLYKSFFEDKTHADIAGETGLPLGTVKSRIRLALDKLRSDKKVKQLWL